MTPAGQLDARGDPVSKPRRGSVDAPAEGLDALADAAQGARAAAAALRWLAACAVAFAGLLLLSLLLAMFERGGAAEPAAIPSSACLDYDLAVLRTLARRSLGGDGSVPSSLWSLRPDWRLPETDARELRLVSPRDAWAAAVSGKSRFRTAARGALDALPLLLAGLGLALLAAAIAGAVAQVTQGPSRDELRAAARRAALVAVAYALVIHPLWPLLDPAVFYDRTRSLGVHLPAALFVGAFAGTLSGAAARALFAHGGHARSLGALQGRPALLAAARLAAIDATDWLLPLLPALAAAAVFAAAKADQDPTVDSPASGLGALIRAAMREPSALERLSSCALVAGGLVVLWFIGHRGVIELRRALGRPG